MSFISEVGRVRLERVAAWLEAGAPHTLIQDGDTELPPIAGFNMYTTVAPPDGDDCGTPCCIAGAVCQFNEPFDLRGQQYAPNYYEGGVGARAAELLGISHADADAMFVPAAHCWHSMTPEVAAKMIRAYLVTGIVDWTAAGADDE